jgi:chromosome segregation ATPase
LVRVQANYSALQSTNTSLEIRNSELYSEKSRLEGRNESLQNQLTTKDRDIEWGKGQLVIKQNELNTAQTNLTNAQTQLKEKEGQLTISREEAKRVTELFNKLQIESNNKDNDLKKKDEELEKAREKLEKQERKAKEKMEELKRMLGKSQLQINEYQLEAKDVKLTEFVQNLNIDRIRVRNLKEAYQKLIRAQENYNQDVIDEADRDIEEIKDEFLDAEVSVANVRKLCSKCKKIAELKVEQVNLRQQPEFQAQQEVPPHNNN